jgi:hypothetical protein
MKTINKIKDQCQRYDNYQKGGHKFNLQICKSCKCANVFLQIGTLAKLAH